MKLTIKIDYISATARSFTPSGRPGKVAVFEDVIGFLDEHRASFGRAVDFSSSVARGYQYKLTFAEVPGAFHVNTTRKDMGLFYQVSGSELQNQMSIWKALQVVRTLRMTFTRVDVAVDMMEHPVDYPDMMAALLNDEDAPLTARVYREKGQNSGYEVGSRTSDVFVRVYNKGLQQSVDRVWTRFEIEMKGKLAENLPCEQHVIEQNGITRILDRAVPPGTPEHEAISGLLTGDTEYVRAGRKTKTDTEKWLNGTVAGTVKKLAEKNTEAAADFITIVQLNFWLTTDGE